MSTYAFLSDDERNQFAKETHEYLIKDVQRYKFHNITGSKNIKLETSGLVSSWMFYFQRSDVNNRNEWSNYTNWPYNTLPQNVNFAPVIDTYKYFDYGLEGAFENGIGPGSNPDIASNQAVASGVTITGNFNPENNKHIMYDFGIKIDGNYRENKMDRGVFEYLEPYSRSKGSSRNTISWLFAYFIFNISKKVDLPLPIFPSTLMMNILKYSVYEYNL